MKSSPSSVAKAAAIGAGGAILCAACCVAPFALSAAALATFGGVLAWLADGYALATTLAVVLVAGAWAWVGFQSARTRKKPASATLIALGAATLVLALALAWPSVEGAIVRLLQQWRAQDQQPLNHGATPYLSALSGWRPQR